MLITIIATLAYLGLAILGWGGFAAFFSHPALVFLAIALFVLSGVALFSGGYLSPGVREDGAVAMCVGICWRGLRWDEDTGSGSQVNRPFSKVLV
jgi:hypothetical protein